MRVLGDLTWAKTEYVCPYGLIRTHWQGLSGGSGVWKEIERFFAELKQRCPEVRRA